jgi:hypothetical protein
MCSAEHVQMLPTAADGNERGQARTNCEDGSNAANPSKLSALVFLCFHLDQGTHPGMDTALEAMIAYA